MSSRWRSFVATVVPVFVPDEPADDPRRVGARDWVVDVLFVVLSAGFGVLLFLGDSGAAHLSPARMALDWSLGFVSVVALWWRRRVPVTLGVVTAVVAVVSATSAAASVAALFTVAVHRRWPVAVALAVLNAGSGLAYGVVRPQDSPFVASLSVNVIIPVAVVAWGMLVRARRQLVQTLRERAERAESEQRLFAERARRAERTRIAREMHDVLAHRISLLALHAGGLELRPDLPPGEVRATALLLRETAHHALEELRGVIGVLRDDGSTEGPSVPQPTLRDIPRLVDDTRRAGAKIAFTMNVPTNVPPPDAIGRDAYRIVQEALTNVAKHAYGTTTAVEVTGEPGVGLRVDVRNRLPLLPPATAIPGSGSGLVGLQERVALTGGTLDAGPNASGEFHVDARLAWPA